MLGHLKKKGDVSRQRLFLDVCRLKKKNFVCSGRKDRLAQKTRPSNNLEPPLPLPVIAPDAFLLITEGEYVAEFL